MDISKIKQSLGKTRDQATKQLADLRRSIVDLEDEIHWLDNAPLVLEDAQRKIDAFFEANTSENNGIEHFFHQRGLSTPGMFDVSVNLSKARTVENAVIGAGHADIAHILLSFLGIDAKRKLYDLAAAAAKDIESGPPLAERPALKTNLLGRKRALEVEEENLICSCEELGIDGFYRRSDCDPEVVLMME